MSTALRILLPACLAAAVLLPAPAAPANPAAERLLERGMELFQADDPQQAAYLLEQALIADPADARVRFWLGRSYWRQEQPAKARRAFDQAIAIDPSDADALYWGGLADLRQDDREAAEEKFAWLERLCGECERALELRAELDKPEEEPFLDLFPQDGADGPAAADGAAADGPGEAPDADEAPAQDDEG